LYRVADEIGATKIALGHHREDILETLLLNMFYGGKLKAMPPKLRSDDGKHIVIRPLAYVPEKYLERYALQQDFPIIPCNLCGSQENLQRNAMKALLKDWEKQHPGRVASIFKAVTQVVPSHLLDSKLFDFKNISTGEFADSVPGDRAIDEGFNEPCQPADETLQLIHILA
jgi:tRNA 2-thiocytidine biosynthesis protein TtcA